MDLTGRFFRLIYTLPLAVRPGSAVMEARRSMPNFLIKDELNTLKVLTVRRVTLFKNFLGLSRYVIHRISLFWRSRGGGGCRQVFATDGVTN